MAANDLRLDILGTSFSITADEDAEYLEGILNQYRAAIENTQKISGLKDPLKIAVLTGFLQSDEIQKLKTSAKSEQEQAATARDNDAREAEQRTANLISRINRFLEGKSPADD
jgi:cell division protein ZapA (FtsZ GTPase activity inhibitor)